MVTLYGIDISHLPDPKDNPYLLNGLSDDRQQRILKYKHLKGRRQSLGAGLLLKTILPIFGEREQNIRFGTNGKPETDKIQFNLSHSGNLVICAVSNETVGCDVEQIGNYHEGVVRRFFSEKEKTYLENTEESKREQAFFRIWTARESYMKLTGEGMRLELSEFEVEVGNSGELKIIRNGSYQSCFMKEYQYNEYQISVCATESNFNDEMKLLSLNELNISCNNQ